MLWICTGCTARYSVGAPRCPQCGSTEYVEEGAEDMPKISVHGGASVEADETVVQTDRGPELAPVSDAGAQEGSEPSSDGTSSSASTKAQRSSEGTSGSDRPSPARAAANRSKK